MIGENPGIRSIIGGAIVILVLLVHAMSRFRQEEIIRNPGM